MNRTIALGALVVACSGCTASVAAPTGPPLAFGLASSAPAAPDAESTVSLSQPPAAVVPPSGESWEVAVAPYIWAASLSGDVQVKNLPRTDFSAGFDDLVDDLKLGVMVGAEVRPPGKDWSLLLDGMYMKLEDELARGEIEFAQWTVEGDLAWRPWRERKFDVLGGARFWELESEVEINVLGSESFDRSWVDPVLGARAFFDLGKRWTIHGRADVGGFGLGSELTYQLLGTLRFELFERASAAIGYRWMHIDYDHDDVDFSLDYYGPIVGIVIGF
jgi:hypothetical protein